MNEAGEVADALVPAAGGVVTLAGVPARAAAVSSAVGRSSEESSGEFIVVYAGDADSRFLVGF